MPRVKTIDIDLDNVDADGVCKSQTPSAGGALTLNGDLGTTLDYARILVLTTADDETGRTFTFTGTDADGNTISEAVTGVNNSTAVTTKFYKTISSIVVDAATAAAITVGTVATTLSAADKTRPLNWRASRAPQYIVNVTGTINYTIQETFDSLSDSSALVWLPLAAHAGKTADTNAAGTPGAKAMRVIVNSYSSGAELQCYITQTMSGD